MRTVIEETVSFCRFSVVCQSTELISKAFYFGVCTERYRLNLIRLVFVQYDLYWCILYRCLLIFVAWGIGIEIHSTELFRRGSN